MQAVGGTAAAACSSCCPAIGAALIGWAAFKAATWMLLTERSWKRWQQRQWVTWGLVATACSGTEVVGASAGVGGAGGLDWLSGPGCNNSTLLAAGDRIHTLWHPQDPYIVASTTHNRTVQSRTLFPRCYGLNKSNTVQRQGCHTAHPLDVARDKPAACRVCL